MLLHIGANVGMILAFAIAVSFFLPVVTDANKTYVSPFSSDNYSLYRAPYSHPHADGWQPETTPEIIHRRRVEGEESSIKQTETTAETPDYVPEGTTGLLNFRAASLPDEIQKVVGAITDEYVLSLDILLPQIPASYDLQVNQVGDNSFDSNYNSQTKTSVVKETSVGLQFNTQALRTIEIKITFEEDSVLPEAPNEDPPMTQHASPVMSQTTVPEENYAATHSYRDHAIDPVWVKTQPVGSLTTGVDRVASSLFRHLSK
jgi:hypothetical protein